jgi:5-methylcytosine-specific restriction protein A
VTLADVTRSSVLAAVEEFDSLRRRPFLKKRGFGPARTYFLDHDGNLYDSKAIVGRAHGLSTGTPLLAGGFTGGEQSVAQRLEALGFKVARLPNPDWTWDEIVLAGELVSENGWKALEERDQRVQDLSRLLRSQAIPPNGRNPDFRNPAGVARKTLNIVNNSSNGNRLDPQVLDAWQKT